MLYDIYHHPEAKQSSGAQCYCITPRRRPYDNRATLLASILSQPVIHCGAALPSQCHRFGVLKCINHSATTLLAQWCTLSATPPGGGLPQCLWVRHWNMVVGWGVKNNDPRWHGYETKGSTVHAYRSSFSSLAALSKEWTRWLAFHH